MADSMEQKKLGILSDDSVLIAHKREPKRIEPGRTRAFCLSQR